MEHETQASNPSSLLSTIYELQPFPYFAREVILHSQVELGDARKTYSIFPETRHSFHSVFTLWISDVSNETAHVGVWTGM